MYPPIHSLGSGENVMARQKESYCINHQDKIATTRCKTCSKPVCDDCVVRTDLGMYCSDNCAEQADRFSDKLEMSEEMRAAAKPKLAAIRRVKFLKKIAVYLVVIILILFGLYFGLHITSFSELIAFIQDKFSYLMEKITG
jgi:B-box zinc finger protein